jgi:YVTN family beta-propeller protein
MSSVKKKFYIANNNNTVSVINVTTDKKEHDINVGNDPEDVVFAGHHKIYVANRGSNTVSVINGTTNRKENDINVGEGPHRIAFDDSTNMIYVVNRDTVSVIDGSTDKVAAGVVFNVNPANSGQIRCNNEVYTTNAYGYVDAGTNCMAQPDRDFEFNTWVWSPLTNRNSSTPLDSSGNLTVNRYGIFTANFKPLPSRIPPEYWTLIITLILTSVIGFDLFCVWLVSLLV